MAQEYSLYPIYRKEFHDIFEAEKDDKEFSSLLQWMKVVDSQGVSQMDEDQWEAASKFSTSYRYFNLIVLVDIYLGFAFEKR